MSDLPIDDPRALEPAPAPAAAELGQDELASGPSLVREPETDEPARDSLEVGVFESGEPAAEPSDVDAVLAELNPLGARLRQVGLGPRTQQRFHASRYQYDIKSILWLFTFCSLVFLGISVFSPAERPLIATFVIVYACLAFYGFLLIGWIPGRALVVFLFTSPLLLIALMVILEILSETIFRARR